MPIDINSMTVSLTGTGRGPRRGFIRNPTSCVPAATLSSTSYADPDAPVSQDAAPFTPTGCDQVPFSPEFSAKVGAPGLTAETHPPLTSVIEQSIEEAGLKRARVLLRPTSLRPEPADDLPRGPISGRHLSAQHDRRPGVAASPLLTTR